MLLGWVKNLKDGTVEAILQGEPEKVNEVIKWCHIGPAAVNIFLDHEIEPYIAPMFIEEALKQLVMLMKKEILE